MEKNQLKHCHSPYLQQHASNPVHWQPWCEEALAQAQKTNKPILLSIGYSACHWCHVMAHESFEDEETAMVMNQNFINIKVDREERPDLDKIYQTAHQILNQQNGGWPLTIFLEPKTQLPFFSGTYFPKEARSGIYSFKTVLKTIAQLYQSQPETITQQNKQLKEILHSLEHSEAVAQTQFTEAPLEDAIDQLEENYDVINGGFGTEPKFPMPTNLQRLILYYSRNPQNNYPVKMLSRTLEHMAMGGIYDQVGGGFFRYSVDSHWEIPHFEKMLYDNGQLIAIYAQAGALLKNDAFKVVAMESANWLMKKMKAPEGSFYSSLDADSLGIEGKFYTWTPQEIAEILTSQEYSLCKKVFNLQSESNFYRLWHLYQVTPLASLNANDFEIIQTAKQKLLKKRRERIAPHKDQKILTSWNALTIEGLALAGFLLKNSTFHSASAKSLNHIKNNMYSQQDGLYACYYNGEAYNLAYLDDYAFLINAIIYQLQASFDIELLNFAIQLANECIEKFLDKKNGGFYFTPKNHETLIQRPKYFMDEAIPSGNGVLAFALNRLGMITGKLDYIDIAKNSLASIWTKLHEHPIAYQSFLSTLEEILEPIELLYVVYKNSNDIEYWHDKVIEHYQPHRLCFFVNEEHVQHLQNLNHRNLEAFDVVAYHCKNHTCSLPITNIDDLFYP